MQVRGFGDKFEGPITPLIKNRHTNIFPVSCHMTQSALSNSWSVGVGGRVVLESEGAPLFSVWSTAAFYVVLYSCVT